MPVALITGASRGLGRALATELDERGWRLILNARGSEALEEVGSTLRSNPTIIAGDVGDPDHRARLAEAVDKAGRLDLLVNNASTLGPSPLPQLRTVKLEDLNHILTTNTLAPLALIQSVLPALTGSGGVVVNISSDAAVEAYPGWGAYGASKAALDQLTRVLAAEQPELRVFAFDPGDMRTEMHQAAFPGEDISDRPDPETVVPALLQLLDTRPSSGRYTKGDLTSMAVS